MTPLIIPPALQPLVALNHWVVWKLVNVKDKDSKEKVTKPPFCANEPSRHASTTDASTWCDLRTAMLAYNEGQCDGIGFVLTDTEIGAFDLDDCRDAKTQAMHPWALDKINRSGSYAEITPSNEGARIIGFATGDKVHRKLCVPDANGMSCELYRKAARFITITGNEIGTAVEMANIDALLDETLVELDGGKDDPEPRGGGPHDLDGLIKDGCGNDFGGDRSRAVWFVIHSLLKQGKSVDDIVAILLDRNNGISTSIYEKPKPEEYARKQVEKAQKRGPADLVVPSRFELGDKGLWYQPPPKNEEDHPDPMKICDPFNILARTSDDGHRGHGLLLEWIDPDGEEHTWAMPLRMVHADGNAIAGELQDAGLRCGTSRAAHELLKQFFGAVIAKRRVRCVDRTGWHDALYVLPNGRAFGTDAESIVFQSEHVVAGSAYAERGTLDEWRNNVARYAVSNDLLMLCISAAFAPPLLDVLGEPSGGVHIYGASQTGKTTLVRCAMCVYGPADDKHMRSWRATANGLEAVAAETSDGLLVLDEISQANAREVGEIVYTLANSAGKARANRAGGARAQRNWRTLFLSTGEITLEAKLAEASQRVRAGQDVRMIGLSADAGCGFGVWQKLHDLASGAALTDRLRVASRTYCGTAGPAYLDHLARDRADDTEVLVATLRTLCQKFQDKHVSSDADGQVRSVAKRFALIAAAGELATAYGVTGWPKDEALRAAGACFNRWLKTRGGKGAAEDMKAVEQVRAFIGAHGASRFERIPDDKDSPDDKDQKILNRAGWKQVTNGEWEFLITPDCWKDEVCRGLNATRAAEAVAKAGFLMRGETLPSGNSRLTVKPRIGAHGPVRVYHVYGTILEGGDDGE